MGEGLRGETFLSEYRSLDSKFKLTCPLGNGGLLIDGEYCEFVSVLCVLTFEFSSNVWLGCI